MHPAGGEDGDEHEHVDGAGEHLDLRVGEAQVLPDEQLRAAQQRLVCKHHPWHIDAQLLLTCCCQAGDEMAERTVAHEDSSHGGERGAG